MPRKMRYPTSPSLEQAAARLFELSPHLLYCLTADGRVLHVNPAFTTNLGWPDDHLHGQPIVQLVHDDDLPAMNAALAGWARGDDVGEIEVRVRCGDGSYRWLALVSSARDLDGTTYGIARDVEHRRSLEQRLRFQAQLLDAVGQAVIATTVEGIVTFWSRAAEELFGWRADEAVGRNIMQLTPSDVSEEHERAIRERTQAERSWTGEFRVAGREGANVPVLVSIAPVTEHDGRLSGFVCIAADISETHRMNMALRESEEQSRRLNEMHQMILDYIPAMVVVMAPNGKVMVANQEWSRITGFEHSAAHPGELVLHFFPDPDKRAEAVEFLNNADGSHRDFEIVTRSGATRNVSFTCVRLSDGSLLGMGLDVTGQRQLEKQLGHSQKMEAIGRLAGGVAHDFNNVLTVISSYTELLLEECAAESPMRSDLQEIGSAASRAARLTRQLLAFGRQQVMKPMVIDLMMVLKGLDTMIRKLAGAKIEVRISGRGPVFVLADAGQLEQVIVNLVVNAADAMPSGGRLDIDVEVVDELPAYVGAASSEGRYAHLKVSDTGAGIREEDLGSIFEPFFTTKELGKGTGLGLPTVYGIVTQSNGHVSVQSTLGVGTTFCVFMPLAVPSAEHGLTPTSTSIIHEKKRATILLCEDEDALRTVIERVLVLEGYTVRTARNGAEAVAIAASMDEKLDLLVTDIVMPAMSGVEAVERITAVVGSLPALFMTGYSEDAVSRHGELRPGSRLISKPFTTSTLLSTVAEMLTPARFIL